MNAIGTTVDTTTKATANRKHKTQTSANSDNRGPAAQAPRSVGQNLASAHKAACDHAVKEIAANETRDVIIAVF